MFGPDIGPSMIIKITKGNDRDFLNIVRDDGSTEAATFPKKGVTSHDAIHYFVETKLNLRRAFWGLVADGHSPSAIQDIAKRAGHASASRAQMPEEHVVQLLQAERLVECFESDAWGTPADAETFIAIASAACEASFVPMPALTPQSVQALRARIADFQSDWSVATVGHVAEFHWEEQ